MISFGIHETKVALTASTNPASTALRRHDERTGKGGGADNKRGNRIRDENTRRKDDNQMKTTVIDENQIPTEMKRRRQEEGRGKGGEGCDDLEGLSWASITCIIDGYH